MATFKVFADLYYQEDNGTSAKVRYQLNIDLQDDGSNLDDVLTMVNALRTAANVATMDAINRVELFIVQYTGTSTPNDASNNQIHALVTNPDSGGNKWTFDVPAWDTAAYEKDQYNQLDGVFEAAAGDMAQYIRNPATNLAGSLLGSKAVSRTHKGRGKKVTV